MKNKILSKAYGGVTEARHRLYGLGLPRQWKVITSTLLLLFTFAIGNVWAENVTWEGPIGSFVSKKLSDNTTEVTVTKDAGSSSKTISCVSSSGQSYLSLNGGGKNLKFAVPNGYSITNIKLIWMSGADAQALPILFGEAISAVGTVESKTNAVTITNGGFKMTSAIATSGATNCESEDNIAIPAGMKEVMIGRSGAYKAADYATIGSVRTTLKFRLNGSSGYFDTNVGTGSTPFIGRVVLTVVPEGYSITYHCNGATSGCPSDVASGATALPSTLATPAKTGYDFDKWYTDEGLTTPATAGAALSANANLYAGWTAHTHLLTWNIPVDATITNPETYTHGTVAYGTAIVAPTLTRDGYDFLGWDATPAATMPDNDLTYTATWQPAAAKHSITYAGYGSVDMSAYPTEYSEGIGIASFAPLTDTEDQHFLGWDPASIAASAKTDQTITATWEDKKVVTFNSNGGSAVAAVKVVSGEVVAAPTAPTRLNWTFQKWQKGGVDYDFATPVTEGITLDAVWSRDEISGASSDVVIINGTTINTGGTLSVVRRFADGSANSHVKFAGGIVNTSTNSLRYITFTIPTGYVATVKEALMHSTSVFKILSSADVTIDGGDSHATAADWDNAYFSLSGNGATQAAATVATAMPAGTYYCGSYSSGLEISKLTLKVSEAPIMVTFKTGEATYTAISATSGEKLGNLFLNGELPSGLVVPGYTFNGWTGVTKETVITASMTVQADLTPVAYNVTLDKGTNGSTDGAATAGLGDAALTISSAATAPAGYTLLGYFTAADGETKVAEADGSFVDATIAGYIAAGKWNNAGDATLYAHWQDNSAVAKIGDNYYTSLEGAEGAFANVADGQTIQLLASSDYADTWVIDGKNVTLDLNGFNLTYTSNQGAVAVKNNGKLTIEDATATADPTVDMSKNLAAYPLPEGAVTYASGKFNCGNGVGIYSLANGEVVVNSGWFEAQECVVLVLDNGKVTVNNGVLLAKDNGVLMGNGTAGRGGYTITVNGGILIGQITSAGYASMAIYHPNTGDLFINGGTLISTNGPAVVVRAGDSEITGGEIIAMGTNSGKCGDKNTAVPAAGIVYDFAANYPGNTIEAAVTGGTVTAATGMEAVLAIYQATTPTSEEVEAIGISGGTFSRPVAEELCAPNYAPKSWTDGTGTHYGVKPLAQSIDMEQFVLDNGKGGNWHAYLDSKGYTYAASNMSLDSLDGDKTKNNYQYLGLKFNKNSENTFVAGTLPANKLMIVKVGAIGNNTYMKIDGAKVTEPAIVGGVEADSAAAYTYWYYDTDKTFSLFHENGGTSMLKAITITDPYEVSFSGDGTPMAPMMFYGEGLTLPTTEPGLGNDKRFDHWCTDVDATIPVVLDAEGKFWPTSSCTLYAAYKTLYELRFVANGADVVTEMASLYYAEGDEVAVPACGFEKTGHVFDGWTYAPEVTVEDNKFAMPGEALALTAQWADNSSVVKVVRENYEQKYDNFLAARNDVRDNGGTIILLQDLEESLYYGIAADITIDLNGHRLASNDGNDLFLVYNGGKLTINGTTTGSQFHGRINVGSNAGSDGTLVLNGGTYTCASGNTCIHVHGESDASEVTLNGVILSSPDDNGVQFNGDGIFTVKNSTISGATGIYIKSGVTTIENSTVNGTSATAIPYVYNGSGSNPTGDGIVVDACGYPGRGPQVIIKSGEFNSVAGDALAYYHPQGEPAVGGVEGGTFSSRVPNELCAPGLVPSSADLVTGKYSVEPKDGLCIIKSTPTSGTDADVDGIYQGSAYFKGNGSNKKLSNPYDYVGVELAAGYTFQAGDKVVLNQAADLGDASDITKFYVFTEVPADGKSYVTVDNATPVKGDNWFEMPAELVGQSSLYIGRVDSKCNPTLGYLAVYRPLPPVLNKVTVNGVEGKPNALKEVVIEVAASTTQSQLEAIAYDWVSNSDAWTADHTPVATSAWEFGVANTVTLTDKDGDQTVYTITVNKAVPSSDATLATLIYGTPATAIALADGVYEYDVLLPYGTSDVPALAATVHHAGATIEEIYNATAFVNRKATSTVTVKAEDNATTQVYTVNFTVDRFESKVLWNGATMTQMSDITAAATAAGVSVTTTGVSVTSFSAVTCEENGKSYTRALDIGGNTKNSRYFGIVIPDGKVAKVSLVYRAKATGARSIIIGTALTGTVDESAITSIACADDATKLHIMTAEMFGGGTLYINTTDGFHVHEISIQLAAGHGRSAMLGAGVLGTVCVPNNVTIEDIQGVTVYELMGRESQYGKLAFDEIISGELEAGVPYVFQAHRNHMALLYGETSEPAPVDKGNGMYGTFEAITLTELNDVYYFAQKALWGCADLSSLSVPANRAYVKLSEVDPVADPNPAPGRRRISMAVNGEQVATGIENTGFESEAPRKVLINGELYIIRGEKMYDAKGQLVK